MKNELIFKLIDEKKDYRIYHCIPTNSIKTGNEKSIMIVVKDSEIVYVPEYVNSQFKMKCKCDKFIDDDFTDAPVNYEYLDDGTKILKDEYYRKEK